ncbi:hypothetical protein JXO52_17235 [bacterium]|nr:hypothetical protein [bacterium]
MTVSAPTVRLFDQNPYEAAFEASVLQAEVVDGRSRVILDRTLFYPASGGQPCDLGTLNGAAVLDVFEDGASGVITHVAGGRFTGGDRVTGLVDMERRFDHMQQHSGQHILSAVFLDILDATTVGFHLSADVSTLDFSIAPPSRDALARAELAANRVVYENRPVSVSRVTAAEARSLPLRKPPPEVEDLRIVHIENLDMTACCGTHVRSAGEVGMIKVLGCEKFREGCRVTFVCGRRALMDYQRKNSILSEAARMLTVGEHELIPRVSGLLDDRKGLKQTITSLKSRVIESEAAALYASAAKFNTITFVSAVYSDFSAKDLQQMARSVCARDGVVCVLGLEHERATVVIAQSADLGLDISRIKDAAEAVIEGRGGGSDLLTQTSGPDAARTRQAVRVCEETVKKMSET